MCTKESVIAIAVEMKLLYDIITKKERRITVEEFKKEVKELSTADLFLILEDQVDLYSDEELKVLRDELSSRPNSANLSWKSMQRKKN